MGADAEGLCPQFYRAESEVVGNLVGGAGTLVITCPDGTSATFTCTAGQILPVVARRVAAASTATGIVGMR